MAVTMTAVLDLVKDGRKRQQTRRRQQTRDELFSPVKHHDWTFDPRAVRRLTMKTGWTVQGLNPIVTQDDNSPLRPVDATRVERADTTRRLATTPRAPTRTVEEETAAILLVVSG
jgi:hypothetical protein